MPLGDQTLSGDALADQADRALAEEDLDAAIAMFHRAEPAVRDPDRCAGGRWMAHMLRGDLPAAWQESDAIRRRGRPDPHRFWNGESISGKRVMLRSLHGFGDAVQMFRFLPRLAEQAASLVVEVAPRLVPLAPCFAGMGEVITWGEHAPKVSPAWDVQLEVLELPYALRVSVDDLGPQQGYLRLPEAERVRARRLLRGQRQPNVGLVWSAGEWNPTRSVPFAEMSTLLETPGVTFWSLQGEPERSIWLTSRGDARCRDSFVCGEGLLSMAAAVEQLDLLITVDTLAAHLAGALGVPCWLLLQRRADWRWMVARDDSPWYPSLRLWRQAKDGGWCELLTRVQNELNLWREPWENIFDEHKQ